MVGTFVNRIGTLLDRRFLAGSWFPALFGAFLLGSMVAIAYGWSDTLAKLGQLSAAVQIWLTTGAFAAVTVAGFLLHVAPVIRLFEGYPLPSWIKTRAVTRQRKRRDSASEIVSLPRYPRNGDLIRPTRLGNILTAAEEYPYQRYRIDAVIWWPRIAPVLPQVIRDQLDEALLPLIFLVNLAMSVLLSGVAGATVLLVNGNWVASLICAASTVLVTLATYRCGLPQAGRYADCIRAAFDLYRHDVLKAMHMALPDDLIAERKQWEVLTEWIYRGEPPKDPIRYVHLENSTDSTAESTAAPERT